MKKEIKKRSEQIGLEEINQVETREVNGGFLIKVPDPNDFKTICCHDIPPSNPEEPWERW